ncbi:hypothetical protein [Oceanobacillus saliphilus]|uniref:hypothetical protein n=1 Tax=Oceanobacillus saliphilus TaxID=2925834 RepID=UPI00201E2F4E|nr:hypothetical protein [Oceanobacillus saliphilus]
MNFNERLRKNMEEKGSSAAKKWDEQRRENARKYNSTEFEKAIEDNKKFHEQRKNSAIYG